MVRKLSLGGTASLGYAATSGAVEGQRGTGCVGQPSHIPLTFHWALGQLPSQLCHYKKPDKDEWGRPGTLMPGYKGKAWRHGASEGERERDKAASCSTLLSCSWASNVNMLLPNEDIYLPHQGLQLPHSRLFSPLKAVISSQTWFSLQTQREKQVLIWTFATNKCLPIGLHATWKFWEILSPLRRERWGGESGWQVGGCREVRAGALQPWLLCLCHQAETWRSGSLKKVMTLMGSGRREIALLKPGRGKHHSSCTGVKNSAGKISHLRRENNIRRKKKSLWLGSVIRPHEKFFLGSNLCPLRPRVPPQAEAAWMCVSMLRSLLSEVQ